MSVAELREKLHDYIESADEPHLSAIFTLVENDMQESHEYVFDEETMNMLNERAERYDKGLSKTYTVEESMDRIRQLKKKNGI
jgi:hypothetical protein